MASDEGWVWSFEECGFPRVISPDAAIVMKVGFHAAGELDTIVGHKTAELGRTGRAWSHPRQAGRPAGPGGALQLVWPDTRGRWPWEHALGG